jgi:HK97 family phage prohead protease
MTAIIETRYRDLSSTDCELRKAADGAETFYGHPGVYSQRAAIGNPLRWGFYEEFSPGAFSKTTQEGDQRFLVDHDTAKPVSRRSAGTLRVSEDAVGMVFDSDLNIRKSYVADLVENLRDKTITSMSLGFRVIREEWSTVDVETTDGQSVQADLRTVLEAQVLEGSAVTFPAYESTDAGLRSALSDEDREVREVAAAMIRRGDPAALERRAAMLPRFADFRELIPTRAPADATRGTEGEPGAPTPTVEVDVRMRGLAARYGLRITGSAPPEA